MKITANRKEDILKRKAEYEAAKQEYDAENERRWRVYQDEIDKIIKPVQEELEYNLSKFSALHFRVSVENGRWRDPGLRVHISCDEDRKFNDDVALAWSYNAYIVNEDGRIVSKRESSSWSGLSATTEAQLESLRQTVKALDYLNSIDWTALLNKTTPNYSDLFDTELKMPEREDFESQLKEAELEDLIGTNKFIKVSNFEGSYFKGPELYVKIINQTPSQYTVSMFHPNYLVRKDEYAIRELKSASLNEYPKRVRKSTIKIVDPVDIVDLDEILKEESVK